MNTKTVIAVILVSLGLVVLAYSGITFTTPGKPVEFLGMHIETTHSHFIPPIVGVLALVGGIVLLLVNPKRAT
jgi:nitrate reductase gamma subunit